MANVWAVIRREYLQRVRSKWFIFSTIGAPLLLAGAMILPTYFTSKGQEADRTIAVVDSTGVLADNLLPRLEEAGFTAHTVPWTPDVSAELTQQALDGEDLGGFVLLNAETLRSGHAALYVKSSPGLTRRLALKSAVAQSALEAQLTAMNVDVGALLKGGDLDVQLLTAEGGGFENPRFLTAYMGSILLYMVILIYSVAVMRATLEEKTSRIVEIVISSMKPWHLMLGKILGVGAVGLTQMAVWFLSGAIMMLVGLPAMLAARPEMGTMDQFQEFLPGLGLLGLFISFFVFGYFMFSGLYAAVGAMCNSDEEAQQAQFPVMLFIIIPFIFVMPIIQSPTSSMAVGLSLVPLFSPILMFARAAAGAAPAWQVGLSFVLMALAVVAVAWVAGRIYKVGILMAGKRPTLPELWRWVREA